MAQGYDTLDSVDTTGANDIADVYQLVVGEAMEAPDLCGWMCTGPLNQSYSHGGYWGRYPLSFAGHPEVWFVRCAPVGSIGKPLKYGELRQVSVLVRESATSKNSVVTNIKLWRRPRDDQIFSKKLDLRQRDRGWATLGPIGVASHAIHIFERRWDGTSHVTLPSVATITRSTETHSHRRIEPMMMTHYVLASSMIGMNLVDTSTKTKICEICYREPEWESACTRAAATFKRMCMQHVPGFDGHDILKLLVSAEDVCEQSSFIGYLDQRADPFYVGALQDDMHKPCGMPLIIAAAVCIASNTERWGLPTIRCDDGFATREANFFIESTLPAVLALQSDDTGATEQIHTIDVAVNYALANIRMFLNKVQAGLVSTKGKQVDPAKINNALMASMNYLMYTGIAVCVDLFGLPPKRSSGQDGLYTPYGFAKHLVDPVMMSRVQSGHDKGLGNTVPRWDTKRTSTRGRRQLALASVLVEVDQWLRTGRYKGVVLHPTAEASESVRPEGVAPASEAAQAQPGACGNAAASAAALAAATGTTRSTKKKSKKHMEALLAERGKMRGARQHDYATDAIRCMLKPGCKDEWKVASAATRLCGEAVHASSAIISDIIQGLECGVCVGIGDLFSFSTHLVSPASKVQCAHCDNTVDVVESIAFSGKLGTCPECDHPRCLECVSADIVAKETGDSPPPLKSCKRCKLNKSGNE